MPSPTTKATAAIRRARYRASTTAVGQLLTRSYRRISRSTIRPVDSSSYWEDRYRRGGTSGAGSYRHLAEFKANYINQVIIARGVETTIEFGCGDGNQLGMLRPPSYVGVDVSQTAVERCRRRYAGDPTKRFALLDDEASWGGDYDLALSLDVIYHLIEDDVFDAYMGTLFSDRHRNVLVYSSNFDDDGPAPHVRNRRFTRWLDERDGPWRLVDRTPNPYPFDSSRPDETTWSDFYLFERDGHSPG